MKFYPSWFLFFFLNMFSILMIMASNNWYAIWMGFELSLLSFVPMIATFNEGVLVYFIVQAVGSALFFISMLHWNQYLLILSVLMKLGLFPFMQWVPMLMSQLSWTSNFLVGTIQKLNPLLLAKLCELSDLWVSASIMSLLIASLLGVNQSQMRSLMAYSSISHSAFLLLLSVLGYGFILGVYFFIYTMFLFFFFYLCNLKGVVKVVAVKSLKHEYKYLIILSVLAFAGFPPFPFFFLKIMIILMLMKNSAMVYMLLLGISMFVSMYFYFTVLVHLYI